MPETPTTNYDASHASSDNCDSRPNNKGKSKQKRKYKPKAEDRFINLMEKFCGKTEEKLGEIAKRIGFKQDASSSRKAIFDALDTMGFLSVEEKLIVATQLGNKTKELDIFFSLSDENKATMFKEFINLPWVEFNVDRNKVHVTVGYWENVQKETNIYRYFLTNGFPTFENCETTFTAKQAAKMDFGPNSGHYPDEPLLFDDLSTDDSSNMSSDDSIDSDAINAYLNEWEARGVLVPPPK
ncbi:hypothetical protein DH2020_042895 [Rehmannia glutinosa]|uniref:Uncharacterized protein n=1 Tax=Rehmannia glutinosa TaxID=99300 RepID=A0ABR0UMD9_REHGL